MRRSRPNRWLCYLVVALAAFLPKEAGAQGTATFEASGPTREVPEGTRFEVAFSLKNMAAKRFIPPDFNGFKVTGGPSELRGAGFVNGKSYSHQTWTYELEAGPPGSYTIGSATVQTAGQTLRTQPLVVRVEKAPPARSKPAPGNPDDRLFITAEPDRETAWLGQQVLLRIKLYTQVGISNYDILDLPEFEGFFAQERRRFDTRTQSQTIKGKRYAVRILYETALYPQQTGALRIGPAQVRLGVEEPGTLSGLLGGRPVIAQSQPFKIQVQALPDPVPPNFSGGVGAYQWQVSADKQNLTTDDALTLTIRLEGNGDSRRFVNPRLDLPAGLEGFDPKTREEEEYETGELFVHARTLEYVVLPKEPGDYSLQPELVFFDPDSNRYRILRAETPIALHVTPGQFYGQNAAPIDTVALPVQADQPWWAGLGNRLQSTLLPVVAWTLGGGLLALGIGLFWRRKSRKRRPIPVQTDPAPARPDLKMLRQQLRQLSANSVQKNSRDAHHQLLKIVEGYLSVYLNLDPGHLTKSAAREQLAARRVPEATLRALIQLWQGLEQAVFAGLPAGPDWGATCQQAETTLQQLEKALR